MGRVDTRHVWCLQMRYIDVWAKGGVNMKQFQRMNSILIKACGWMEEEEEERGRPDRCETDGPWTHNRPKASKNVRGKRRRRYG